MSTDSVLATSGWRGLTLTNVFTKSVADRMLLALLVGLGMFLMGVWMGPLYNTIAADLEKLAAGLPEVMTALFGEMTSATGFINAELYSLFAPAMLVYVAVASAAKAFAGEEENLSVGLLAANPISRTSIAIQKGAGTVVHVVLVSALTGLGVWSGVVLAGLDISGSNVVAVSVQMGLLGLVMAALAMLIAVATGRRVISMAAASAIALLAYVWASFTPLSETLESFAVLSPWNWYFSSNPLANGMDWGYAGLLALLAAALFAASVWVFDHRDLPG
jgi:ABC-2 type transport system permease protein